MSKSSKNRNNQKEHEEREFLENVVEIRRVSKKTKGGNRLRFTALVVVGDRQGRVGASLRKAPDVTSAIRKAVRQAKENLIEFPLVGEAKTIPHEVELKVGAAHILMKPAPAGTGIRAGGPMRAVLEAGGVKNVVGKILRGRSKKANVDATIKALRQLKPPKK